MPRLVICLLPSIHETSPSFLCGPVTFAILICANARQANQAIEARARGHGWVQYRRQKRSDSIGHVEKVIFKHLQDEIGEWRGGALARGRVEGSLVNVRQT